MNDNDGANETFVDVENNEDTNEEQELQRTEEDEGASTEDNMNYPARTEVPQMTTRSGRVVRRTQRLQESSILPKLRSFIVLAHHVTNTLARLHDNSLNELCQLFAYPASMADTDTMYLHEAMRQEDKEEFLKAMVKEIEDHTSRGHWRITSRQEMKERNYKFKPIAAIWSFKRKRNPFGDITKYKARLCCHGGQTVKGVHYEETFSPVVAWSTVRMLLTLSEVYRWHARQIDFVLAFPQAKVKTDVYMQVPEKFKVEHGRLTLDQNAPHPSKQDSVVKLIKMFMVLRMQARLGWITFPVV